MLVNHLFKKSHAYYQDYRNLIGTCDYREYWQTDYRVAGALACLLGYIHGTYWLEDAPVTGKGCRDKKVHCNLNNSVENGFITVRMADDEYKLDCSWNSNCGWGANAWYNGRIIDFVTYAGSVYVENQAGGCRRGKVLKFSF